MLEIALISFTTFFATVAPFNTPIIFSAITAGRTTRERGRLAFKGSVIAVGILVFFAVAGEFLLNRLGITLAALRVAGGVLLLLIAIEMVFAKTSGASSTTDDEHAEAIDKADISVFPLATPLLAGPGAMGAAMLLSADAGALMGWTGRSVVIATIVVVCFIAYVLMLAATPFQKVLGLTGMQVISRVIGVLLAALAVQFVFDGLKASVLFT